MNNLSEALATELSYFQLLRQQRLISSSQYQRQKKRILERQADLNEIERQRRLQAEFIRREAERKRKLEVKRDMRRVNVVFNRVIGEDVIPDLIDAWKATNRFGPLRAVTGMYDFEILHTAQSKDFLMQFYLAGSDGGLKVGPGDRLLIVSPTNLPVRRLRQMFRDGIQHCVFVPILKKLEDSLVNCKSKDSAKRYSQRIAKIKDLEELYSEGVPEEKMEEVAKASGFKIIVHNILGKEIMTFNENGRVGVIKFSNTRPNHVELGSIVLDQDFELVSEKEICRIWKEADMKREFYMIEGDIKNDIPRRLRFLDRAYRVKDENEDYFEEMNSKIDLNRYKFNATKYPEVNKFIKAGRIINAWVCPFTDEKPTGHLDMPKAYAQFKKCDWYSGFMGVIHQWRDGVFDRQFISEHIGMYEFRVTGGGNELFKKLGMVYDSVHILPSPEILYFMDKGLSVDIYRGVWGSRMDFEFDDDMLSDRRYCLWSGRLGMEKHTRKFSFAANVEWASHLMNDFGNDCFYWSDKKICSVSVPVKNVMTTHHIFAFLTSYVRIQMMEAMSKFRIDQLVRVVLDGIYFVGEKPMGLEWFKEKEIKDNASVGFEWYSDIDDDYSFPQMIVKGNTLLTGQGGAGKTYKIMTDTGFNKILFVTPQHVLGGDVREKYGVNYTTIHKLIGEECRPWIQEHAYPAVLFVDEITQIAADWIDRIFKIYKDSLVILAGDVIESGQWFQCRNGCPGQYSKIWKPTGVDVVCVEGDRRSRDNDLRDLKVIVRNVMTKYFTDGDTCEEMVMKMWAKKKLQLVKFADAVKIFETGDVWIAGTHRTSAKLLENGVCSGWYKHGGFVSFEEKEGYEKRGSFTIHSFQGRTLETGKIFISVNDLFEYSMLYTAISRAVSFDQLVFVE